VREWEKCLDGASVRHLLGLAVNLAITPFTILLAFLPGAETWSASWFVYRSSV
jgi:hypothetical protein